MTGKFGLGVQNERGQGQTVFCQENALVIANILFQQHKRRLYTWISTNGQYQSQTDYILWSWRCSIQSAKTRPGADCGSDHELLIGNFRFKLKEGKTTRLFRHNLNQISYNYTTEVMKIQRIRSDRVPERLWTEVHNTVQEAVTKTFPKKCKKVK